MFFSSIQDNLGKEGPILPINCALGAILLGGVTCVAIPGLDVANNTLECLVALGLVVVIVTAMLVGAVAAYGVLHNRCKPLDAESFGMLEKAGVGLAAAYLCLIGSAIIFTWLAWWEDVLFSKEPVLVFVMLALLVGTIGGVSFFTLFLGQFQQKIRSGTTCCTDAPSDLMDHGKAVGQIATAAANATVMPPGAKEVARS